MLRPDGDDIAELFTARTSAELRTAALHLMPRHRAVVRDLASIMAGRPLMLRLLDAPSHEFGPAVYESNPMMGLRGARMGLIMPEVYRAQVWAIYDGAADAADESDSVRIEIAVPMVASVREFRALRALAESTWSAARRHRPASVDFRIGVVIETPRAAQRCGQLAREADFLSFGTNDLTQFTWGLSRDDGDRRVIPDYQALGILSESPFRALDDAVGLVVAQAMKDAREVRPSIEIGVCGEVGTHPVSLITLVRAGVDYISCSPSRVPLARVLAGKAAIG